jgi:hypothetical protein
MISGSVAEHQKSKENKHQQMPVNPLFRVHYKIQQQVVFNCLIFVRHFYIFYILQRYIVNLYGVWFFDQIAPPPDKTLSILDVFDFIPARI